MPRLIVYNIAYAQGCTGRITGYLTFWQRLFPSRKKIHAIAQKLHSAKPDIVGLVEVDIGSTFAPNQFALLQQELNAQFGTAFCKYATYGFAKIARIVPILGRQANGLMSKYKIIEQQQYYLSCGLKRLVSKYVILLDDKKKKKQCTVFVVHLALGKRVRAKQISELAILLRMVTGPLLVIGDFNAKPHELITLSNVHNLVPSAAQNTFPAFKPKRQIDYILASPQIKITKHTPYYWQLSDHLPLCVDFDVV